MTRGPTGSRKEPREEFSTGRRNRTGMGLRTITDC